MDSHPPPKKHLYTGKFVIAEPIINAAAAKSPHSRTVLAADTPAKPPPTTIACAMGEMGHVKGKQWFSKRANKMAEPKW
jgi:hypothetical protein